MPRIDDLLAFVQDQPRDPLPRYALALEYRNLGNLSEAVAHFQDLILHHPTYVPTYLMLAQTLIAQGDTAEARTILQKGIVIARSSGNPHAASEMQDALENLGTGS
jgi:predicted Zn-dependent protease